MVDNGENTLGLAWRLNTLAHLARSEGDWGLARASLGDCLVGYREVGHLPGVAYVLHCLGMIDLRQSDYDAARPRLEEGLAVRGHGRTNDIQSHPERVAVAGHGLRNDRIETFSRKCHRGRNLQRYVRDTSPQCGRQLNNNDPIGALIVSAPPVAAPATRRGWWPRRRRGNRNSAGSRASPICVRSSRRPGTGTAVIRRATTIEGRC